MVPATISRSCQTDSEPRMNLAGRGCPGLLQKLQQQVTNFLGLLLLHPVAGAIDQMTAEHARARACLHRFKDAGALISAPVLFARDEASGHVDTAAGICFEFGGECALGATAIPLQPTLESGAGIFGAVEGKLAVGQPCVGRNRSR